ncbi:Transmembrane protein 255B, partial [Podarcis lilfordi]
ILHAAAVFGICADAISGVAKANPRAVLCRFSAACGDLPSGRLSSGAAPLILLYLLYCPRLQGAAHGNAVYLPAGAFSTFLCASSILVSWTDEYHHPPASSVIYSLTSPFFVTQ